MTNTLPPRTGGRVLVDQLRAQGVERVTCVPGESYLAVLDALYDSGIDTLVCRAEGGAAMMAEAYGKLTGRPGVCFVTRGPGATNACHGVHIAMQDSTPMILFIGQVERGMRGREAFQEVDYEAMFAPLAKWAVEVDSAERLPELVARAFRVALQGRPGPVVVSLPEDLLTDLVNVPDAPVVVPALAWPAPADMARLAALLAGMRGVEQQGTRRWVSAGAWLAIAASGVTFWLSKTLIQSLARYGEKLEAVISILAVIILLMVTNWVFHKFYWVGWNAKLRSLSKSSQKTVTDRWEWLALIGVGFLTVYREGFETTLFMQSLLLEGSVWPVVIGVLLGTGFIAAIGVGIFVFGAKLPYRKLLVVTGVLVVSIMVTFFGSPARLFQPVGWLPIHSIKGLTVPTWAGTWLGLYPSWEGILIPMLALVYVGGAWLWVKLSSRRAVAAIEANHPEPVAA